MSRKRGDQRLLDQILGKTTLPEDFAGKRALTGLVLRSPEPWGELQKLEEPGPPPPGVVTLRYQDIPGCKELPGPHVPLPLLSGGPIRWPGQSLLLAAGPDKMVLQEWLSRFQIHIDKTTPPEDEIFVQKEVHKGDLPRSLGEDVQVIEETVTIPSRRASSFTFPPGAVCQREGNHYTIHTAGSWADFIQKAVSSALDINKSQVKTAVFPLGEGHPLTLGYPALFSCQAAVLAQKAKQSVSLLPTPYEIEQWGARTPEGLFHLKARVGPQGKILALEGEVTVYAGGMGLFGEELLNRVILGLTGLYTIPVLRIRGVLKRSPAAPAGWGAGGGLELGFLAAELLASRAAELKLQSPVSWRLRSFPAAGQPMGLGITVKGRTTLPELLARGAELADFERKQASCEQTRLGRGALEKMPAELRGIGLAAAWSGDGFAAPDKEIQAASLSLRLEKEGKLYITAPAVPHSPGLVDFWAAAASSILGLENRDIHFSSSFSSEEALESGPSGLGRHVGTYTRLLEQACQDLSRRRFRDPLPLEVTRSRRRYPKKNWDTESLTGNPFEGLAWGTAIIETTLDIRSLIPSVRHVWLCIDAGKILDEDLARSALETAAAQALAWCQAQLPPPREKPLFPPAPGIHLRFPCTIEFLNPQRRSSALGLSTLPWLLLPSAFLQAVSQASGKNLSSLPVSPEALHPLEDMP